MRTNQGVGVAEAGVWGGIRADFWISVLVEAGRWIKKIKNDKIIFHIQKRRQDFKHQLSKMQHGNYPKVNMGNSWKCNCEGDFELLIERVVQNGTKVYLVSSAKKNKVGPRYATSRFSTKLRNLLAKYPGKVLYLELDDWKKRIKLDNK
ncbi:MAG: hypothetical protein NUV47_01800 [Patescibacteria group bacterium]|nr:hypothetical protein [Patescibacteria group bacterium]